jgi:hypothetical protein
MPRVGFEPTIPALERVKTVHALDSATTVIENYGIIPEIFLEGLTRTTKIFSQDNRCPIRQLNSALPEYYHYEPPSVTLYILVDSYQCL